MSRGIFHPSLVSPAWFAADALPAGWFDEDLLGVGGVHALTAASLETAAAAFGAPSLTTEGGEQPPAPAPAPVQTGGGYSPWWIAPREPARELAPVELVAIALSTRPLQCGRPRLRADNPTARRVLVTECVI